MRTARRTRPSSLDRAACERRVYRLATLLTGQPLAATRVIERVVDAQPDLRRLDSAHLDRLTALRSREIAGGRLADERLDDRGAAALASMTSQQREAWVFRRVYELPSREAARSMDCSVTAAERHLLLAEGALAEADVDRTYFAQQLRDYGLTLDVPDFYRRRREARRRRRRVALVVVAVIALAAAAIWLLPRLQSLVATLDAMPESKPTLFAS